jgi:hypothetical protein
MNYIENSSDDFTQFTVSADDGSATMINNSHLNITGGSGISTTLSRNSNIYTVGINASATGPADPARSIQFNSDPAGTMSGNASLLINDATNQMHLNAGTAAVPTVAFSDAVHPAGNYDTGIFRSAVNEIGISCAGTQRVAIASSAAGDNIPGINVGLSGGAFNSTVGLRRLSTVPANSWEDGHIGNSTAIYFTATDFMSSVPNRPMGVPLSGRPAPNVPMATTGTTAEHRATKIIPKGFLIVLEGSIRVSTHAGNVAGVLNVVVYNIEDNSNPADVIFNGAYTTNGVATGTGSGSFNIGTGINAVSLSFKPDAGMSEGTEGIVGARIEIKRT